MAGKLFIAADGGGTKTEFALFSREGQVLKRLALEGSNPNSSGFDAAVAVLDRGFSELEAAAGGAAIAGRFAGVSGAMTGGNDAKLAAALGGRHPGVIVESDVMNVVYSAGIPSKCVAAIAGTGSAVFGYDGTRLVRSGGWGYLLDDAGGGYDIGREALRLCLEADDDPAAEPLELVRLVEKKLGGRALDNLASFYREGPSFIASFAPLVLDAARRGDDLARRIVRKSAARLAELALAMRGRCDCGGKLVLSGGLVASQDVFLPMVEDALAGLLEVEVPTVPQICGACRRCLALCGEEPFAAFCGVPVGDVRAAAGVVAEPAACPAPGTEARNQRSRHIDKMDTIAMLRLVNDENRRSVEAVGGALGAIARAVEIVADAFRHGGRLIYAGAGTSGRLAVQDASECPPTYGVDYNTVVANIAGGEGAVFHAVEQVEDSAEAGRADLLARGLAARDVVMGVSASGNAAYVVSALQCAKEAGCRTIALSSNKSCRIAEVADVAIFTDTGAEVVTGSTRMKAGNAQKMVMNMVTTCAMVMTGKVYENMMVNLRPTNAKLLRRMVGIVSEITGRDAEESRRLLESAGFSIRKAIK